MPPWTILYVVEQSLKCSIILGRKGPRKQEHKPCRQSRCPSQAVKPGPGWQCRTARLSPELGLHFFSSRQHKGRKGSRAASLKSTRSHFFPQKKTPCAVCSLSNLMVNWAATSLTPCSLFQSVNQDLHSNSCSLCHVYFLHYSHENLHYFVFWFMFLGLFKSCFPACPSTLSSPWCQITSVLLSLYSQQLHGAWLYVAAAPYHLLSQ